MKKISCFIIICALILSMSVFPTFAQNSKISNQLLQVLSEKSDDDTVDIYVTPKGYSPNATEMPSWPDIAKARKELNEYYDNWFITEFEPVVFENIHYEEIVIFQNVIIVSVKAQDVYKIAECDLVYSVDYFENGVLENESEHIYIDRLFAHYPETEPAYYQGEFFYSEVGEMDVDYDDGMDYAIIFAHYAMAADALDGGIIGDRIITQPQLYAPFRFGYALYDLENDEFIPFSKTIVDDYTFLPEYMEKFSIGTPLGDVDADGKLSILDATFIQLVCAKLAQYSEYDYIGWYGNNLTYVSDMNKDGARNVLDATAIQLSLAELN